MRVRANGILEPHPAPATTRVPASTPLRRDIQREIAGEDELSDFATGGNTLADTRLNEFVTQEEAPLLVAAAVQPPPPPPPPEPPEPDKKAPRRLGPTDAGSKTNHKNPTRLSQFLRDLLSCPPRAGEGVHTWLFKAARQLHAHRSPEDIFALLSAAVEDCGRDVPESEIRDAIAAAAKCPWKPGSAQTSAKASPKWPPVNKQDRQDIIDESRVTLAALRGSSPVPCNDACDAEHYIDSLFPGTPLLCVGLDNSRFKTAPRESFRGQLSELSLIVPSPMIAPTGPRKKDGGQSAHTSANTGPRRYLVTEFDPPKWETLTPEEQQRYGTEERYYAIARDEQAAIISHLRQFGPLVMVLSSGGKSLHAWWYCEELADDDLLKFMRYAVSLGADHATWTRSQFVRLPGGWRADKQRRQEVLFFDPSSGKAQSP